MRNVSVCENGELSARVGEREMCKCNGKCDNVTKEHGNRNAYVETQERAKRMNVARCM